MDVETRYRQLLATPTDIRAHLPALRSLAAGQVVELGVRYGTSTIALLAGQPDALLSVDIAPFKLDVDPGRTRFEFVQADSRAIDIPPCDLLFIDTLHTYRQLQAELARHASQARRIALHDTEAFGRIGEDGGPGLWPAVEEFLETKPWQIESHDTRDNGFTVLVR